MDKNISTYALYHPNDAYLEHGLISWVKHRYIKREGTPGNYKYIYPRDLAARRASRNDSEATLFGDRTLRSAARSSAAQARRLERSTRRAERRAQRLESRALQTAYKLNDPTLSDRKRARLSKRATDQRVQAEIARRMVQKLSEAALTERERANTNKFYYDRSRKIDDMPRNIVETGRAYINAIRRSINNRALQKRNNPDVQARYRRMQRRDARTSGRRNAATGVGLGPTWSQLMAKIGRMRGQL